MYPYRRHCPTYGPAKEFTTYCYQGPLQRCIHGVAVACGFRGTLQWQEHLPRTDKGHEMSWCESTLRNVIPVLRTKRRRAPLPYRPRSFTLVALTIPRLAFYNRRPSSHSIRSAALNAPLPHHPSRTSHPETKEAYLYQGDDSHAADELLVELANRQIKQAMFCQRGRAETGPKEERHHGTESPVGIRSGILNHT